MQDDFLLSPAVRIASAKHKSAQQTREAKVIHSATYAVQASVSALALSISTGDRMVAIVISAFGPRRSRTSSPETVLIEQTEAINGVKGLALPQCTRD